METGFKKKAKVFDICITAVAAVLSVGIMIYGVFHFGIENTWPELVLNLFYIACLVMMWMYFFNIRITSEQFNYWTSVCVGMTILLYRLHADGDMDSTHHHLWHRGLFRNGIQTNK